MDFAIDHTFIPGQATGTPLPGFLQGRWWAWSPPWVVSKEKIESVTMDYFIDLEKSVYYPQRIRACTMDMENLGKLPGGTYINAEREWIVHQVLDAFARHGMVKTILIDFWVGLIPEFQHQRIVAALESGPSTPDKRKLFDRARRHRSIVRKCGLVTQNCTIDRPENIDFKIRWMNALADFMNEAYPGTQTHAWLCGAYYGVDGMPELSEEHCHRIADAVWAKWDSFSLYGGKEQNNRFGRILSERMGK